MESKAHLYQMWFHVRFCSTQSSMRGTGFVKYRKSKKQRSEVRLPHKASCLTSLSNESMPSFKEKYIQIGCQRAVFGEEVPIPLGAQPPALACDVITNILLGQCRIEPDRLELF